MKAISNLTAVIVLGLLMGTAAAQQSDTTPTINSKERVGRVVTPDPPKGNLDPLSTTGIRPPRPERNAISPEVQDKLQTFRSQAEAYVRQQDELRKRLIGAATEAERERLREQLRTVREKWLERAREVREETRDRLPALIEQLPNRREMLRDAAQEKAAEVRNAAQQQIQEQKRRGGE